MGKSLLLSLKARSALTGQLNSDGGRLYCIIPGQLLPASFVPRGRLIIEQHITMYTQHVRINLPKFRYTMDYAYGSGERDVHSRNSSLKFICPDKRLHDAHCTISQSHPHIHCSPSIRIFYRYTFQPIHFPIAANVRALNPVRLAFNP